MKLPPPVPAATAAALLAGAQESSGSGGSARSGPRASWQRTALVLVGGSVLSFGLTVVSSLRDESTVEDFHVRQLALDGHWLPSVMIGLLGPINEEILYRALLFARCVRMLGVPVSLLIQFAVFGGVHASDTSDKVLLAGWMGVILSVCYYASGGVLLVPIVIHATNNSLAVLQATEVSPLRMHEQLEQGKEPEADGLLIESTPRGVQSEEWLAAAKRMLVRIRTALGLLRVPEKEGRAPQLSDGVYAFFQSDVQTLRPDVRQMIDAIFASLDRGGKGYLTPDELAWAVQLSPEERINTAAAWQVIERRVRASPTATDGAVINVAAANSPVVPDQLCPNFFSVQQIAANRARLFALEQAHPSLAALVPSNPLVDAKALVKLLMVVDRRSGKNCCCSVESSDGSKQQQPFPQEAQPVPSPDAHVSAQLRCFHAYLNKRARTRAAMVSAAASRSNDDDSSKLSNGSAHLRVTRAAFEHYVARQLLMHPGEGAVWLSSVRAALWDERNAHPTRELLHEMRTLADSTYNCKHVVRTQIVEHMENKLRE
jgi:membrane protease YdiL (CAAX protease family)